MQLSAETIAKLLKDLPVGVWVARAPGGEFLYANSAFEEIMGMGPVPGTEAGGYTAPYGIFGRDGKLFPEEELPFARALKERRTVIVDGIVIHRSDGRRVNVRAFGKPMLGPSGEVELVMVSFYDVTAQIEAETQAAAAHAQLELAIRHAPIILWATDENGVIRLSQGAGLKGLGLDSDQHVGRSVFDLYAGNEQVLDNMRRALQGESFSTLVELRGAVVEGWMGPMRDAQGKVTALVGINTDVTERVRAREAVSRSERMAAMGTLAASVAHEINNPLAYVLEGLRSLERELGGASNDRVKQLLNDVKEGAERVRVITSDLQTFTRRDEPAQPVELSRAARVAVQMLAHQLEGKARLKLDLEDGVRVSAHEPRVVQVLMNLLLNALHAVNEVQRPGGSGHEIRVAVRGTADEALIEVGDTGPGIKPDVRERIFEPFVTTKAVGEGTGLGLFVCRNLVTELKGSIEVEGDEGAGALFRVRLPRLKSPSPRQGARVLLIDDNVNLGRVMASALNMQKHHTVVLSSGREAVEHLARGASYDVVFCDLMMADISGMDVYEELKRRRPGAESALVFMTGGAFTDRARAFLELVPNERLQKPFDICAQVARLLERRAP